MSWLVGRVGAGRLPRRTVRLRLTVVYVGLFLLSGAGLLAITYVLVASHTPKQITASSGAVGSGGGGKVRIAGYCPVVGSGVPTTPQIGQCVTFLQSRGAAVQHNNDLSTLLIGSGIALGAMTLTALGVGWVMAGRVLRPLRTITSKARNISASNLHERLAPAGPDDELKELGDTVDELLARLECSFQAQRQFVANASHELRTPLARQRTVMEVALADPQPSVDGLRAVCQRVLAAGEEQERLIEALLTLARSQRGLDRWELVDLAAVAADVARLRQPEADAQQIQIRLQVPSAPVLVWGDERLVERLLANLVDNGLRYNVAGGQLTVKIAAASEVVGSAVGSALLQVANTGEIVPPGEVARLFAPFQRLGQRGNGHSRIGHSRTGHTQNGDGRRDGQGLGLSIVSAIAAAHHADLEGHALPGGGLDVRLRFPPVPAGAVQVRAADQAPAAARTAVVS